MATEQPNILRFNRTDLKRVFRRKPCEEVGPYDFTINKVMVEQADAILFIDGRRYFVVKSKLGRVGEVPREVAERMWAGRFVGQRAGVPQ